MFTSRGCHLATLRLNLRVLVISLQGLVKSDSVSLCKQGLKHDRPLKRADRLNLRIRVLFDHSANQIVHWVIMALAKDSGDVHQRLDQGSNCWMLKLLHFKGGCEGNESKPAHQTRQTLLRTIIKEETSCLLVRACAHHLISFWKPHGNNFALQTRLERVVFWHSKTSEALQTCYLFFLLSIFTD